jgi:hypothetical protein
MRSQNARQARQVNTFFRSQLSRAIETYGTASARVCQSSATSFRVGIVMIWTRKRYILSSTVQNKQLFNSNERPVCSHYCRSSHGDAGLDAKAFDPSFLSRWAWVRCPSLDAFGLDSSDRSFPTSIRGCWKWTLDCAPGDCALH